MSGTMSGTSMLRCLKWDTHTYCLRWDTHTYGLFGIPHPWLFKVRVAFNAVKCLNKWDIHALVP